MAIIISKMSTCSAWDFEASQQRTVAMRLSPRLNLFKVYLLDTKAPPYFGFLSLHKSLFALAPLPPARHTHTHPFPTYVWVLMGISEIKHDNHITIPTPPLPIHSSISILPSQHQKLPSIQQYRGLAITNHFGSGALCMKH